MGSGLGPPWGVASASVGPGLQRAQRPHMATPWGTGDHPELLGAHQRRQRVGQGR